MIVVDASYALKLALNEPDSQAARAHWRRWGEAGEAIIAPPLFWPETFSVIRQHVQRGILAEEDGQAALLELENLGVVIQEPAGLYRTAWQLARRFNRPTVYDCCYLVLAAITGCELWTADKRLINAVGPALPWLRGS